MCHPEFYNRIFWHCDAASLRLLRAQYSKLLVAGAPSGPLRGPEGAPATTLFCGCDGVGMRCGAFPRRHSHRVKYGMTHATSGEVWMGLRPIQTSPERIFRAYLRISSIF